MLPSNEIPPIDINASGTATIQAHVMRNAQGEITSGTVDFIVNYNMPGAAEFTGLHIHRGGPDVNGPVVINTGIGGAGGNINDPAGRGNITRAAQIRPADTAALAALRDMVANPAGFYVNLHTTVNPGGVIRGQLQVPETLTLLSQMSPRNEVPAITTSTATGVSAITVMRTRGANGRMDSAMVLFEADYVLDGPTAITGYHIHNGPAGVNAPVVVNTGLTRLETTGRGTLTFPVDVDLSRQVNVDVIDGIFADPAGFYANIHTVEAPGGLIRGQLRRTDENTFYMNPSPANEVPALTLDASGAASFKVHSIRDESGQIVAARALFNVNYRFPGETRFTGLHIHNQVAGQNGPVTIDSGITGASPIESPGGFGNIYRPVLVTSATALATLNSMMATPERHYINLHTTVNPGGAIREQVAMAFTAAPQLSQTASGVGPQVATVAPGGLMNIWGLRMAYAGTDFRAGEGMRIPVSLNGVDVTVGGRPAPILEIQAPGAIQVQVPFETEAGNQPVMVRNAVGTSNMVMANVQRHAPAIYGNGNIGVVGRLSDMSYITAENPATTGDVLLVLLTGMGQTIPPLATGRIVDESPYATMPAAATIADRPGLVAASLAFPGIPGLYVVAVAVGPGTPSGMQPLEVTIGGVRSNRVMLPVR